MANLKSSKKRIRSNKKKEARNRMLKSSLRNTLKSVEEAIQAGDIETAEANFNKAVSALDSAYTKGIMKKNTASRKKSQLARMINEAKSAA
ncbi:30S ribosomal protein S20 [Candidatus Poribacteria bacterium]|nr:30S ribosomal protein S20 [Candidatus Poribacteria bacterium]